MTEDMTRDNLHEQILNTVSYWGGVGVGVDSVELTEEIMAIVDTYAGVQRRTSLRWAADECRREARWRLEKRDYTGSATAGKLGNIIRNAADIDEHVHRVRGETP